MPKRSYISLYKKKQCLLKIICNTYFKRGHIFVQILRLPIADTVAHIKLVIKNYNQLVDLCNPAMLTVFTMHVMSLILVAYQLAITMNGCSPHQEGISFVMSYVLYLINSFMYPTYFALAADKCYTSVQSLESLPR